MWLCALVDGMLAWSSEGTMMREFEESPVWRCWFKLSIEWDFCDGAMVRRWKRVFFRER